MSEAKKNKKNKVKIKEVEEGREIKEKVEETKLEEKKLESKGRKPEKSEKKKKSIIGPLIALGILVFTIGGLATAKIILTQTTVATESVELSSDARGFSNYFKEYLFDRAKAEKLFSFSFRNISNEEILTELAELKDGFSRVSQGIGTYKTGDYKEMAEIMGADATTYLSAIRELRGVMTASFGEEGDRQLAFIRKVEETTSGLRSALYIAPAAFSGDVSGLSSKGVLIFQGDAFAEVGGGVMNIFVGDVTKKVTAVSTEDMGEVIKRIEASGLFGYTGTRMVKIGEGLEKELEGGWVKNVKAEVGDEDVKVTRTRISLVMENLWSLDEKLKAQGINGLVEKEKKSTEERLTEFLSGLKGGK